MKQEHAAMPIVSGTTRGTSTRPTNVVVQPSWFDVETAARDALREGTRTWIRYAIVQNGIVRWPNGYVTPGSLRSSPEPLPMADPGRALRPYAFLEEVRIALQGVPNCTHETAHVLASTFWYAWQNWAANFQLHLPGAFTALGPGPIVNEAGGEGWRVPVFYQRPLQYGSSTGEAALSATALWERIFNQLGPEPGAPQAVLDRAPPLFGQAKSGLVPDGSRFMGLRPGGRDDALMRLCRWFAEAFQTWKSQAYLKGVGYKKEPRKPSTAPHPLFGPISNAGNTLLFGGPTFDA
jgi:hypothetical protein